MHLHNQWWAFLLQLLDNHGKSSFHFSSFFFFCDGGTGSESLCERFLYCSFRSSENNSRIVFAFFCPFGACKHTGLQIITLSRTDSLTCSPGPAQTVMLRMIDGLQIKLPTCYKYNVEHLSNTQHVISSPPHEEWNISLHFVHLYFHQCFMCTNGFPWTDLIICDGFASHSWWIPTLCLCSQDRIH